MAWRPDTPAARASPARGSRTATSRSGLTGTNAVPTVADMSDATHEFFDRYAAALLARDERSVAALYAVPALILFPGQAIAVSEVQQTERFFAASWGQYEGVDAIQKTVTVIAEGPGTVWADVTWSYGSAGERFCYQLVQRPQGWQIAVLTLLA